MYHSAYADIMDAGSSVSRRREREALDRAITLMQQAREQGPRSPRGAEAIFYTNRVWAFLVEDLSLADNDLPDEVRANLISLGIYVIRKLGAVRGGDTEALDDIIDITQLIRDGLQ
ncbi:MAG: flagellar biosynthesis regulator FlaF [Rhizobiaceae bacterium]|jgi:flagellar protein FlaF|nr:flagellar biosynthesis regulator FlaF [Rhizobiaceae bacterium]